LNTKTCLLVSCNATVLSLFNIDILMRVRCENFLTRWSQNQCGLWCCFQL